MGRRIRSGLVALLLAAGIVVGVQSSAQALSYNECPLGLVCVWDRLNGGNNLIAAFFSSPGTCYNLATFDRNKAQSFYNHLNNGKHVQFYDDPNCTGPLLRREANASQGPHAAGTKDSFCWNNNGCGGLYSVRRLDSIWFNNG